VVQHSTTANIPVTNVFQGRKNISFLEMVEVLTQVKHVTDRQNLKLFGGLNSDKRHERFFCRGKEK
jgi:hypothetical protein